jgi:hypothetical protein
MPGMKVEYIPLMQVMRDLHRMPRGRERFQAYLRTMGGPDPDYLELPSLNFMNPMGKDHVAELLDALLALDADGIAARTAAEAAAALPDVEGDFKLALVVADDRGGGWTNRFAYEFDIRFGTGPADQLPRWLKHNWITAILWSSEPAREQAVREAIRTAMYRMAYVGRHGPARTVRDKLAQEGEVLAWAGCTGPVLDAEDIAYTREVLVPYLDADDMRTTIECLFGDAAGRTLGFTPRGLSPWAGLALALDDQVHRRL